MELKIKVEPYVVTATHKAHLMSKVKGAFRVWSGGGDYGWGLTSLRGSKEFVRVYNIEKQRRKFKVVTDKKKLKQGIKKELVREAKWTAYCYDFPVELLRLAGLKVKQGTRTFSIEKI